MGGFRLHATVGLVCFLALVCSADADLVDAIPVFLGHLKPGETVHYDSECFGGGSSATLDYTSSKEGFPLVLFNLKKVSFWSSCTELYLFVTRENYHLKSFFFGGKRTLSLGKWAEDELDDVLKNGVALFVVKDGYIKTYREALRAIKLFKDPKKAKQVRQFLELNMGVTFVKRADSTPIEIPESMIKSGDCLQVNRFIGSDMLINYATGGPGHVAVFLWLDGVLHVVESLGNNSAIDGRAGIIRTPYKKWLVDAVELDFQVAVLPLSPERRALFNESAAIDFFLEVEGLPYGDENFFFGWVDTRRDNYPPPLTASAIQVALPLLDVVAPDIVSKMVIPGLVKRLDQLYPNEDGPKAHPLLPAAAPLRSLRGDARSAPLAAPVPVSSHANMTIHDVYAELESHNMTVLDLAILPELDSWRYNGEHRLVCSSFTMSLWKAAGLFPDAQFNAAEFTPKDVYQLNIFNDRWARPEACYRDAGLPYCQVSGSYLFELTGFNTINPYDNMNDGCPSQPPIYYRPNHC